MTLPQVAATTVAYHTVNAAKVPLISHEVLNAVRLLVVVTSIGGPLLTQYVMRRLRPRDEGMTSEVIDAALARS